MRERCEGLEHAAVEAQHVPLQRPARAHGNVRKAVDLRYGQSLAVEPTQRDAAALGAEVDCNHRRH